MKSRAANEQQKKVLEKTREQELKRKQANVRKRMQAKLPTVTPTNKATKGPSLAQSPNSSKIANPKTTVDGQALLPNSLVDENGGVTGD